MPAFCYLYIISACTHFRGQRVAVDVAAALVYLHEQAHVIHADCKSLNVLLTADGRAKLAGMAFCES